MLSTKERKCLWVEDDALTQDRERLEGAYRRLFGVDLEDEALLVKEDYGDSSLSMTTRAVVCVAYDGGSIYALTEEETGPDGVMVHELKCWPKQYRDVSHGTKPFELRKMDRRFRVGDLLDLREWGPESGFTGMRTFARVDYLLVGPSDFGGLEAGYCIMGLGDVSQFGNRTQLQVANKEIDKLRGRLKDALTELHRSKAS